MKSLLLAFVALSVAGCGDTIVQVPTTPSPAVVPAVVKSTIEFRVLGTPTAARVRVSNPVDGLAQVVTTLPYETAFTTTQSSMFLSLEATPLNYQLGDGNPFFAIQIIVNGQLFREATASDFTLNTLSVSGTWRQ